MSSSVRNTNFPHTLHPSHGQVRGNSESARVCAKWQWNARDCYWIARLAKPVVQSINNSRVRFTVISHTPVRSRFYHTHVLYSRNWDGSCLVWYNFSHIFFKFAIWSIALINLGETCLLKRLDVVTVCERYFCCADIMNVTACNNIMTSHGLYTYYVVTQCMNGLWIFITAILLNNPILIYASTSQQLFVRSLEPLFTKWLHVLYHWVSWKLVASNYGHRVVWCLDSNATIGL